MNPILHPSRRAFLKTTAAATLAAPALTAMLRAGAAPAIVSGTNLNSRMGVGFIGTGGRAGAHMKMLEQLREQEQLPIEFAAVCDINWPRVEKAQARLKAARAFMDHRELLADKALAVWMY